MIRSLKALGLLTAAALAISALAASAAQAEVNFTAGLTPSTHTTTNIHGVVLEPKNLTTNYLQSETAGGLKTQIGCTSQAFYGTVTNGTAKELTLKPHYTECGQISTKEEKHVIESTNVTFTTEGCDFVFEEPTHLEGETYTGGVKVECPKEKKIIEHIFADPGVHTKKICTIEIGPQTVNHIVYHNEDNGAAKDDILATFTLEGIKYTTTGVLCPEPGKTKENTKWFSSVTLTSGETVGGDGTTGGETVSLEDDLWLSTV